MCSGINSLLCIAIAGYLYMTTFVCGLIANLVGVGLSILQDKVLSTLGYIAILRALCVCLCVCVCVCCVCVCAYVCMHVCVQICVHICVCACMHVCTCVHVHLCMCMCICDGFWENLPVMHKDNYLEKCN